MGQCISFVDWHSVGHSITRIHNNASCSPRCIQRENCLDCHIHCWNVEGFEHDLGHALTIRLWIQRSLSKEDWMFFWGNTQFIVESVMPNFLHVVPVCDNSVLYGILESQYTSLTLSFITHPM